jgi:ferrous iron transport protein A
MTLAELGRGTPASVIGFSGDSAIEALLREIGFAELDQVEVLTYGPIGGSPLSVRLNRTVIALRRDEAACVQVQPATTRSKNNP